MLKFDQISSDLEPTYLGGKIDAANCYEPLLRMYCEGIFESPSGLSLLSGAFVLFGFSWRSPFLNLEWYNRFSGLQHFYGLRAGVDIIIGCDVLGDFIVNLGGKIYRMDGETGDLDCIGDSVKSMLTSERAEVEGIFGASLARKFLPEFWEREVYRVLPERPYVVAGEPPSEFFVCSMQHTILLKQMTYLGIKNIPDGERFNFDYWAPSHDSRV